MSTYSLPKRSLQGNNRVECKDKLCLVFKGLKSIMRDDNDDDDDVQFYDYLEDEVNLGFCLLRN